MLLTGCGVSRPDTNIWVVNVPGLRIRGYNLKNDYNDDGTLKKSAKAQVMQFKSEHEMLLFINKFIGTDPDGLANLKAYISEVREFCN